SLRCGYRLRSRRSNAPGPVRALCAHARPWFWWFVTPRTVIDNGRWLGYYVTDARQVEASRHAPRDEIDGQPEGHEADGRSARDEAGHAGVPGAWQNARAAGRAHRA